MSQLTNYQVALQRRRDRKQPKQKLRVGKRKVKGGGGIESALDSLRTVGARRRTNGGGANVSTIG